MKLLVLGGTLFLGRHIVEVALDRRHDVTLFNRGHTRPDLFPQPKRFTATAREISVPYRVAHGMP